VCGGSSTMQQPVQLQLIASNWSQLKLRKKSWHVKPIEQWWSFAGISHSDSSPTPKTVCSRSASAARRAPSIPRVVEARRRWVWGHARDRASYFERNFPPPPPPSKRR
jgi:hypothetical protein